MKNYYKTGEVTALIDQLLADIIQLNADLDTEEAARIAADATKADRINATQTIVAGTIQASGIVGNDIDITRSSDGANILQYREEQEPDVVWVGDRDTTSGNINVVLRGDVYVSGTTHQTNVEQVNIADNKMILNSDATGTPTEDASVRVNRGSSPYSVLNWNEMGDYWEAGISGDTSRILTEDYGGEGSEIADYASGIATWVSGEFVGHTHTESDITDLSHIDSHARALANFNSGLVTWVSGDYVGHTHTESEITDLDHTDIHARNLLNSLSGTVDNVSDIADWASGQIDELGHIQNTDTYLASGTADQSSASEIRTHLDNLTKHRLINDDGYANTELWSAEKISGEITAIPQLDQHARNQAEFASGLVTWVSGDYVGHNHTESEITDLSHIDIHARDLATSASGVADDALSLAQWVSGQTDDDIDEHAREQAEYASGIAAWVSGDYVGHEHTESDISDLSHIDVHARNLVDNLSGTVDDVSNLVDWTSGQIDTHQHTESDITDLSHVDQHARNEVEYVSGIVIWVSGEYIGHSHTESDILDLSHIDSHARNIATSASGVADNALALALWVSGQTDDDIDDHARNLITTLSGTVDDISDLVDWSSGQLDTHTHTESDITDLSHIDTHARNQAEFASGIALYASGEVDDIGKVMVSSDDTTPEYLIDKLTGTSDIITVTENNPGYDENIIINVGSGVITNIASQQFRSTLQIYQANSRADLDRILIEREEAQFAKYYIEVDDLISGLSLDNHNHNIGDLSDVDISSPTSGQTLVWDGSSWKNSTSAAGDGGDDTLSIALFGNEYDIVSGSVVDLPIPYDCTISGSVLTGIPTSESVGSMILDIRKDTYDNWPPTSADSIVADAPPTITNGVKSKDDTLTGWTKTLTKGNHLRWYVIYCSGLTQVNSTLYVNKS